MRICIFGAGGVGGYFGGRLAQVRQEVSFIARGENLKALREDGLKVESIEGDFQVKPVRATDNPAQIGPVDVVLLAVKTWQVPEAARQMAPLIGQETGVVFLGNGVDAIDQLSQALGGEHVFGGMCHISAFIARPGTIRHTGIKPDVVFGELDGSTSWRTTSLKAAFDEAGVVAEIPADVLAAVWQKFVFIAAISGVGAITRAPIGVTRKLPGTRRLLEQALDEIIAIAGAKGIHLPQEIKADTLAFIDGLKPAVTASMQRDIIEGKPSELESQNGAVVRLGQECKLATPVNRFIYDCLLPQELRARREIAF